MELTTLFWLVPTVLFAIILIISSFTTISQGTIGVTEVFGKYKRVMKPGLNFKIPFFERLVRRVSTQNRTIELKFQAVTNDQANVYFSAMLLYIALDEAEETIKNIAYKFTHNDGFITALTRTVEGSIRALVATKKQAEVLGLRKEIVDHVKENIDATLQGWGFHLTDLQVNDITFDEAIMESMSRVVVALNNKNAAENEGEAERIRKEKSATADSNSGVIRAKGIAEAREILNKSLQNMDPSVMAMLNLDKYCDTISNVAENGKGKIIFIDPSGSSFNSLIANMHAISNPEEEKKS